MTKEILTIGILKNACNCSAAEIAPKYFGENSNYTHICENCLGGISAEKHNMYCQDNEISGYDEYHEEERSDDAE